MTDCQVGLIVAVMAAWSIFGFCLALPSLERSLHSYHGRHYVFIALGGPIVYIFFLGKLMFHLGDM